MIRFLFRHLVRHWQMNLIVLAGMLLSSTLLSGLTMYAAIIAGDSLSRTLQDALAPVRNLSIHAPQLTEDQDARVRQTLGGLVQTRVEIHDVVVDALPAILTGDARRPIDETFFLRFWSFDPFDPYVELVEGRKPQFVAQPGPPYLIETLVGTRAARRLDLQVGDEIVSENGDIRVRVVGIVQPVNDAEDLWWSDLLLLPLNVEIQPTETVDKLYLSLIVPPQTMAEQMPHNPPYWRILLHWDRITADNALDIRNQIVGLEAALTAQNARTSTGLVALLDRYQAELSLGRISLMLLAAQSVLAVLYILSTLGSFLLDQSQVELSSLAGRGFSGFQIALILALESLIVALGIALPLGPLVAFGIFRLWSMFSGSTRLSTIPPDAWALSAAAIALGWLALVIPLYFATRKSLIEWQQQRAHPNHRSWLQRLSIDVFLLVLGGLVYWQLRETGSFVRPMPSIRPIESIGIADPVLMLGPSVLLLAIGLVFLRIFPLLLRLLAWICLRLRSLVIPLGFTRLARAPSGANRVVLLISITVGLIFFATVFEASITQSQHDVVQRLTGADLRVALPLSIQEAQPDADAISQMPGVKAASMVYVGQARWGERMGGLVNWQTLDLFAIDPETFAQVAYLDPGMSRVSIDKLMAELEFDANDPNAPLPVIASPQAVPRDSFIGGQVEYQIAQNKYRFEIRDAVADFPTQRGPFAITNLLALESRVNLDKVGLIAGGVRELWLTTDPAAHATLVRALRAQDILPHIAATFKSGRIAGDARSQLASFQSNLIARTTTAAFGLNALILVVLSSASLVLIQIFSARGRVIEFGVLRAMGLSTRQLLVLLSLEGAIMVVLGLLTGTGIGYGLALVMRPFLSLTLKASIGGQAIDQIVIHWPAIARFYLILAGFYALALGTTLIVLLKSNIHRTLRLGDE